jgi:hypothetical protein
MVVVVVATTTYAKYIRHTVYNGVIVQNVCAGIEDKSDDTECHRVYLTTLYIPQENYIRRFQRKSREKRYFQTNN